jgi:chaperone required for assembly of F1-ATPase
MSNPFDEIFTSPLLDPNEAARRNMRPNLPRRFYKQASAVPSGGSFQITLDGRSVKTPNKQILAVPNQSLAEDIAVEWNAQGETIDPAQMPLTRLANSIIDGVSVAPDAVAAEIEKYLGSDLLFYRAEAPEGLVARQTSAWDPILAWARDELGARFMLAVGISFVSQSQEAIARAQTAIPNDPWRLGAVHVLMTLTGSALLALAVLRGAIGLEEAWAVAHVDEDWNMQTWGRDEVALGRRASRLVEAQAAAKVLASFR